jgi:hypothetical protein
LAKSHIFRIFDETNDMSLLALILVIVLIGVVLWLINAFIPMEPRIKMILNWVVIIFLIIWLLKALGVFAGLGDVRV